MEQVSSDSRSSKPVFCLFAIVVMVRPEALTIEETVEDL